MERIPCDNQAECPLPICFEDIHHVYYPASQYVGYIATHFRSSEDNKQQMCRQRHQDLHAAQPPPEKPTKEYMAGFLIEHEHKLGTSGIKQIRKELRGHK